jgi:hypothetical protein
VTIQEDRRRPTPRDVPARRPGEGLVAALVARGVAERGARLLVARDPQTARDVIRGDVNSPRTGPPVGVDGEVLVADREPEQPGCPECWGNGDHCGGCGGWGVTTRHGDWIRKRVAGSGATGPSTARNTDDWDIAPDDPWADATSVIDIPF